MEDGSRPRKKYSKTELDLRTPTMTKPISRHQHMMTDYAFGPLIALAPNLLGFDKQASIPTLLCRYVGGGILAATSVTRAEGALLPIIPWKLHLAGDVAGGLFALGAPWLLGFSNNAAARNTFLGMGAIILTATSLSQTEEMP